MKKLIASVENSKAGTFEEILEDQLYQIWDEYYEDNLDISDVTEILYEHIDVLVEYGYSLPRNFADIVKRYVREHYSDYNW